MTLLSGEEKRQTDLLVSPCHPHSVYCVSTCDHAALGRGHTLGSERR